MTLTSWNLVSEAVAFEMTADPGSTFLASPTSSYLHLGRWRQSLGTNKSSLEPPKD